MAVSRRLRLAARCRGWPASRPEGGNQRCVDLLELQSLRCNAELPLSELQEQPKAVAVRTDGMRTDLTLLHQPTREEAL
jgi:hypothetical protein